jgi:hypothetical protein
MSPANAIRHVVPCGRCGEATGTNIHERGAVGFGTALRSARRVKI